MPGLLVGCTALVTGAGSGIGEAISIAMAREGARIVAIDINIGAAVRVARAVGENAVGLACDVTDRTACDVLAAKVRDEIGSISILVNNAGIIRRGKVSDANTRRDWDDTLAVNLDGPYNVITAFLDQLRDTKGSVINIGSIQSFVALPNSAAYTASKGGVRLLTKALAMELGPMGIRVNAIGPGFTPTRFKPMRGKMPDIWPILPAGFRWAGSATRRTSPCRRFFSPPTWRATSLALRYRSTAAI